jgi:hypothetical protein
MALTFSLITSVGDAFGEFIIVQLTQKSGRNL